MKKITEFFQNPYTTIAVIVVCIFLFNIGANLSFSQKFIDKIISCKQNPANSFPCNGGYDIALMVIASIIGIIFLGILIFDIYKFIKTKNYYKKNDTKRI